MRPSARQGRETDTGPNEGLVLVLLLGQIFFFALALSLLRIVGTALFLVDFGSEAIGWLYIVIAFAVSALSYAYAGLQRKWPLPRLSILALATFSALVFLGRLGLALPDPRWVSFALMALLALGMQTTLVVVGGQAGQLFDVRQMKRLFPVVLTGMVLGYLAAGLVLPALKGFVGGTENLLLVGGVSMLTALGFLLLTIRRFGAQLSRARREKGSTPAGKSLPQLLKQPYVAVVFTYQALSTVATQLIAYVFLDQAVRNYPGVAELADFMGEFTIALFVLTFLFLAKPAGYLLSHFGLGPGLAANPVAVAVSTGALIVIGFLLGMEHRLFFWLAVASRILDMVLSVGTTTPSIKTTYQTISAAERPIVETAVEGIGVPVAFGFTGLVLLCAQAVPGLNVHHVVVFILLVTVLWGAAGVAAYRAYADALLANMTRRAMGDEPLLLEDASTLAVIEKLLAGGKLHEVRLALDMLEQGGHESLDRHLVALAERRGKTRSPSGGQEGEALAVEVFGRIEKRRLEAALPAIEDALDAAEPAVAAAALRAFCALGGPETIERAVAGLDAPDPKIRLGAMVGLLRYGGLAGILAAAGRLLDLCRSADAADRAFMARVIGEVGEASFYQPLLPALEDDDLEVRRSALAAAGRVRHADLLPSIVDNLTLAATRSLAMSALIAAGEAILPVVEEALAGAGGDRDEEDVIRLVRACGEIRGERVVALLKQHLDHPDDDVQYHVLAALAACGYRAGPPERPEIGAILRREVEHAARVLAARQDLGEEPTLALLDDALEHELAQARRRSFLLLSFLHDASALLEAEKRLIAGSGAEQALAYEMLELTLSGEERALILPLVDERLDASRRRQELGRLFDLPSLDRDRRLREIIAGPAGVWTHGWTRACAIYGATRRAVPDRASADRASTRRARASLVDAVEGALAIAEPPIRETAAWALHQLAPKRYQPHAAALANDDDEQVARLAAWLASGQESGPAPAGG